MKHLSEIVDKKNYRRIVRAFGGSRIWVPKIGNLGHREKRYFTSRDAKIRKLRKKYGSVRKIAASFNLSEKRIYNILNNRRKRSRRQRGKRARLRR